MDQDKFTYNISTKNVNFLDVTVLKSENVDFVIVIFKCEIDKCPDLSISHINLCIMIYLIFTLGF